jgi:hypothetical protein
VKDVSALMDGELESRKVSSTIVRLEDQDELRDAWSTFHVIRDTLQGNAIAPSRFVERFHERLEREPAPVLPFWRARMPRPRTLWIAGAAMALPALIVLIALRSAGWMPGAGSGAEAPFMSGRLDDRVAAEYALAHRQLVPAFVSVPAADAVGARAVPAVPAQPAPGPR